MTFMGAILALVALMTTIKVSTDVVLSDPDQFDTAIYLLMVGSLLSAVLLFWKFDVSMPIGG